MSEKRKADLLMNFLMSVVMIFFMCSVNKLQVSGFSWTAVLEILIHYPLETVLVMLLSGFVGKPAADWLLDKFSGKEESESGKNLLRTIFLTTVMSMIMTICGPLVGRIGGDFSGQFAGYENFIVWCFATWIDRWRMNFTMALFWNLICAGPFCRWAMGQYLKSRQKKEENNFEKEAERALNS